MTKQSLLDAHLASQTSMQAVREGHALNAAAEQVLARLPPGRATLVATSPEGVGLAAVCASVRPGTVSWLPMNPILGLDERPSGHVVVVEPIDPGSGWQAMVRRVLPDAAFVFADGAERKRVIAA